MSDALPRELAEQRFGRLYSGHAREILGYALRRCTDPEDAADVVAETFLAAWRRLAEVPHGEEGRLWLYGTARFVLANHRRGELRRSRLAEQLRAELGRRLPTDAAPGSTGVVEALKALEEPDRELLMLVGWEELTPAQAAQVLGVTPLAACSGPKPAAAATAPPSSKPSRRWRPPGDGDAERCLEVGWAAAPSATPGRRSRLCPSRSAAAAAEAKTPGRTRAAAATRLSANEGGPDQVAFRSTAARTSAFSASASISSPS